MTEGEHWILRTFRSADQESLVALWDACNLIVPQNDPRKDMRRKMDADPDLFLIAESNGDLVGSCMAGYDGHRGWINYLAVLPDYQGLGIARDLMEEAEKRLRARGCPKINLMVRSTNQEVIAFYEQIGFRRDEVTCLGKRLENDEVEP